MPLRVALALAVLAACGPAGSQPDPLGDGGAPADARADAALPPYTHTITLDGSDDFAPGEAFPTTTAGFGANIAWDADHIYVGYSGDDLATGTIDAATKWLFVYVDADPGDGTGAGDSQTYNTQHATFPAGFGAEYYLRWKCDGTFTTIEQYDATAMTWSTTPSTPQYGQAGDFLEVAFPRALLGGAPEAGIVTYMINEGANVESSYAGLYTASFVDGYAMDLAIGKYLRADFASSREPNDPDNEAPPQDTGSGGK